jgi:hypothetical protein
VVSGEAPAPPTSSSFPTTIQAFDTQPHVPACEGYPVSAHFADVTVEGLEPGMSMIVRSDFDPPHAEARVIGPIADPSPVRVAVPAAPAGCVTVEVVAWDGTELSRQDSCRPDWIPAADAPESPPADDPESPSADGPGTPPADACSGGSSGAPSAVAALLLLIGTFRRRHTARLHRLDRIDAGRAWRRPQV